MNTKQTTLPFLIVGLAVLLSFPAPALATNLAGYTSGTQSVLSTVPLKNGQTVSRVLYSIGIVTDANGGPFHGATQQCLVSVVSAADGSAVEGRGSCDGIDGDGDVWWLTISSAGDGPIHWTITGGTGKYKGVTGSGVNNPIADFADGITIGRFEGEYTSN